MNMHCVLVLERAVRSCLLLQLGRIVEEPSRNGHANIRCHIVLNHGKRLICVVYLNALAQLNQLVLYVSRSLHRSYLYEVLEAPLAREFRLLPLAEDV